MRTKRMKRLLALTLSAAIAIGTTSLSALADGSSIAITKAENGGRLVVTATMTAEAVTGTAVAALYSEDNELLAVQTKEAASNVSFTFDRNEDANTAKVMWWDDLGHITPQANADTKSITETDIYLLMNIPYDEFYAAQSVTADTDYDAISSATNKAGNYGKSGGAYHSGTTASVAEDGTVTAVGSDNNATNEGVIWPVKASNSAALEALASLGGDEITDESKVTVATLGRGQTSSTPLAGYQTLTEAKAYSYYILSNAPAYYIELTTVAENKPVFGTSHGTADEKAEITPTVTYGSNWGDVQLGLSDAADVNGKQINAVVLTAQNADGEEVTTITTGLVHLYNVWSYSDVAWRNSQIEGLNGATLKNIRYYCNAVAAGDSEPTYYVYDYPMNVQLLPAYTGTVTAAFESKTSIALTGLPQNIENPKAQVYYTTGGRNAEYTYLTPLVVDPNDDDIDPTTVDIVNGKIAIAEGNVTNEAGTTETYGTPVDGTTYTIAISSDNYAPFKVTAEYTEPEVTITDYTPIDTLVTDYIDQYAKSYNLPEKVTFNLSDGTSFDVDVDQWSFIDNSQVKAGSTATAKALLKNAPSPYNNEYYEYFDTVEVTMQVTFNGAQQTEEISFEYDEAHLVENVMGKKIATYQFDENPVLTVSNYTGDGNDIRIPNGSSGDLTVENGGLTYSDNKLTVISSKVFEANGFRDTLSGSVYFGDTRKDIYISYTTNRVVQFEERSANAVEVSYSGVSRKKDFAKKVTLTNVTEEDIAAITFTCSNNDIKDSVTLTPTETENEYTMTIPYNAVSEYLSLYMGSDTATIVMRVNGVKPITLRISYMGSPSLSIDKDSYYATENPVVTMNNFSFENTAQDAVAVSYSVQGSSDKTDLTKDTHYTVSDKKLTLNSAAILGSSSLDAEKTITLYVKAADDDEEASVAILYKKDKQLVVDNALGLSPYADVWAALSGSEEGYSGIEVYYNTTQITDAALKQKGSYNDGYTYYVYIPYSTISEYLDGENSVTLTAKLDGSPDASFKVTYGEVDESGNDIPIETTKVADNYGYEVTTKQGDVPMVMLSAYSDKAIGLIPTASSTFTEADWLTMGATIKKKGSSDEINVGVASFYQSSWSDSKAVILNGLALTKFDGDNFKADDDGNWPVYTITLYKTGCKKAEIDVVLYKYTYTY